MKNYDVIIIGSGIGGLICANFLAKETKLKILLIEKNQVAGGFTSGFYKKGYYFESGTLAISIPEVFIKLLNDLKEKMGNEISIENYNFSLNDQFINCNNPGDFLKKFSEIFPHNKKELTEYFTKLNKGVLFFQKLLKSFDLYKWFCSKFASKILMIIGLIPPIIKNLFHLLHYSIKDEETFVKGIFKNVAENPGLFFIQMGAYKNMKMLVYLGMWNEFYYGTGHPKNSFLNLVDKLLNNFRENGGKILYKSKVNKINIKDNKAVDIVLNNGKKITSTYIVSNIDLKKTVFNLIGKEHFPKQTVNRLNNAEVSSSIIILYLGLKITRFELKKLIPCRGNLIIISEKHDAPVSFEDYIEHCDLQIMTPLYLENDPTKNNFSSITVHIPVFSNFGIKWNELNTEEYASIKKKITDTIIKRLQKRIFKKINEFIDVAEVATPKTLETWCGTTNGATSGFTWDQKKSFLKTSSATALYIKTSISNLFHIGAFSSVNGGVTMSAITGKLAADMIKKRG